MPAISEAREAVTLRGDVVASLPALRLAWHLEDRGFTLEPLGDRLRVRPADQLTANETAAIRAHRDELLALARYCDGLDEAQRAA